jgi:hypothetical protein
MSDRALWPELLADFSRRNAGRPVRLEVDDPEFGAQRPRTDFPLLGVSYDPHGSRVAIMLGQPGSTHEHLTHAISAVSNLDLLRVADGRDEVLCVEHGGAKTLLRLD